jgi:hypothetical protein
MGLEAECTVRHGGRAVAGKARLEETEVVFRGGDLRLKLPLRGLTGVESRAGTLRLRWKAGEAAFALGAQADRWAAKITNPPGLMQKLGVKPGLRVSALALAGTPLQGQLDGSGADVSPRLRGGSDLVLAYFAEKGDLARLAALRDTLRPAGALWAVWRKGRKELREDDVRAYGKTAGLVDVKVMSFSDVLSGLKLVIPKKDR